MSTALRQTPTIFTGPCRLTPAGPYAAWMPRKSLHGRIHGVSRGGKPARTLQPGHGLAALQPMPKIGHPVVKTWIFRYVEWASATRPRGGCHRASAQVASDPAAMVAASAALSHSPAAANWPIARCRRRS
ncbi:hypothetical protein XabCFBP2524_17790 [Xanthomonas axonopodis pv. begoniae]|nr:hypothetical protein XabCFBP2524_17790 [Xanthomonas axonopodis pv. begoniae]